MSAPSPVLSPGIYTMAADLYHADPCPAPSLSSSGAWTLLRNSPRHALFDHPKLNAAYRRTEREEFDLGTAAHAYILEGDESFTIIDAADFRTKAAQEARVIARQAGKTPLLAHRWADVQRMAVAVQHQLAAHEDVPIPLSAGQPEQTLIWQEGGIWCRARVDWLHDDYRTIDDLKTTSASANPEVWGRRLWAAGHDLQAAFYRRGVQALFGIEARFRFVVIENTPPFALSVISLDPAAMALADHKVLRAITLWKWCLDNDRWPGYPTRTCYAELPPWEEAQWLERELREEDIP